MTTEEIQRMAAEASRTGSQRSAQLAELRARWLDLPENYNIFDAVTSGGNRIPVNVSSTIAPVGCHYRKGHIDYLVNNGYSNNEAIKLLATQELYRSPKNISVPTAEELITWGESNGIKLLNGNATLTSNSVSAVTGNYNSTPTPEQVDQAKQNKVNGPSDVVKTSNDISSTIRDQSNPYQVFPEDKYVEWLCEVFNEMCRSDSQSPKIPTSVCVSIALAKTGCINTQIGQFNFWNLPHDDTLTTLTSDNGKAAFKSEQHGAQACVQLCHRSNFKDALVGLEDEMEKTTEENKKKTTKAILAKLNVTTSDDDYEKALSFVSKYNLRDWDTDKKVSEGGHADQTTKNNSKTGKDGNNMQDTIAKGINRYMSLVKEKGTGFEITPVGSDHVKIVKLPKGKTPCEPIYPDYIMVGDTVPEWVFSDTYAKIAEAAEKKAFEAAGIKTDTNSNQSKINEFNKELDAFKDAQFTAWCKDNNIIYTDEAGKKEAEEKYAAAVKDNPDQFKDGIYLPDESSVSKYNSLLEKRKSIVESNATTSSQQAYQNQLQSIKQEIANREGNWNQDSGTSKSVTGGLTNISNQTAANNKSKNTDTSTNVNVEKMVQWAINIANDDSHGYSQANRNGPDYDCSSFVYHALNNAGFSVSIGNCDTLEADLTALGWSKHSFDKASLIRGDILLRLSDDSGHTDIYVGNGQAVGAHGVNYGGSSETGDQGNNEIYVAEVSNNFQWFFRAPGNTASKG